MASLAIVPASGSITAKKTACRVTVSAADSNDLAAYDADLYPSSPEIRYYLLFDAPAGTNDGRSYVFAPNGGSHVFNNYIFPASGSWTVRLKKASDDSDVTTLAVTVNA